MDLSNYVPVTGAVANAVLEKANIEPDVLNINSDNTFTAVFNDIPMSEAQNLVNNADKVIEIALPEPLDYDQPNVEPNIKSEVTFGFLAQPAIEV